MKRFSSALLGVFFLLTISLTAVVAGASSDPDGGTDELVRANTAFAFALYQHLKESQGNLFYSPISISSTASMALAGARGETAAAIAKVIAFSSHSNDRHAAFGKLIARLTTSGNQNGNQLSLANALWIAKGHGLLKEYVSLLKTDYGAGVQELDFAGDPDGARKIINSWIEQKTSGNIKDLLAPGSLGPPSRLVLTNAVYFKGTWENTFDEKATKEDEFQVSPDKNVTVPMMNQTAYIRYLEKDDFQAVELPYKGRTLSMIVVLPRRKDGLARLENSLSAEALDRIVAGFLKDRVDLSMPKFKVRSKFDLTNALKALGMTAAFSAPPADFSGINGKKDLHINAVVHEAFVDVSEKGTEAAAATGMILGATMSMAGRVFKADHPFVFVIRDTQSGSILFMGRVVNPAE